MNEKKVVLAFSGGLDTSYCLLDLRRRGYQVHSAFVDSGGVDEATKQAIERRAKELGAQRHWTLDASQDLWDEFVVPLVWSGARTLGQYPMLCSDRYVIVRRCLELCEQLACDTFAHGCTGMGNDQLRFDQTVRSLGEYRIVAPIRELQSKTSAVRAYEIDALRQAGHTVENAVSAYSINQNLLGVTISGSEIDAFEPPAETAWQWTHSRDRWPREALAVTLRFEGGRLVAMDESSLTGPALLAELNRRFGAYGVGRHIYTGDVTIGLKGRIAFECPGVDVLLSAHTALEEAVLTRFQNQFKQTIAQRWAELVYAGFFYEPHKFDLEAYLASSQRCVTGKVTIATQGGSVSALAIESERMLRDPLAVYAQSCHWSPEEAEGFIKLLGQSTTLSARINGIETCKN